MLLGWSVAGMAWTMVLSGDPDASVVMVAVFTGVGLTGSGFAYFLYRPLLRRPQHDGPDLTFRPVSATT